jgi:hypothetical protein
MDLRYLFQFLCWVHHKLSVLPDAKMSLLVRLLS